MAIEPHVLLVLQMVVNYVNTDQLRLAGQPVDQYGVQVRIDFELVAHLEVHYRTVTVDGR